jgi:pyridoxal phosphate enzyme (YggS family)
VQTGDRLNVAQRLSQQRPASLADLQVCIQVNISGEASKHGVEPVALAGLAREVGALPRLRLRGLMAIPEPDTSPERALTQLRAMRQLHDELAREGVPLDTLSMGMSDDLEAAIAEGATLVRVGRAIFGDRARKLPTA